MTENGITLSYTYDERGNCISESDGTSTKNYTYNLINQRGSYVLTVGGTVVASEAYTYDVMYRLSSVTTDYSTTTYAYDTWGNRISDTTRANSGLETIAFYNYDAANRLVAFGNVVDGSFATIENYAYNLDGSMYEKTAGDETSAYAYDGAGRLTVEVKGSAVKTYGYDAANNRTSMYDNGTTTTYTYDANNRMLTETEGGVAKTYTYDANGNMLTGDGATYTYNARGQQASYSKSGTTAAYTYLPTGLRKSKTVVLNTTNYVWDGQNMAYEYNGSNTASGKAYFYGLTLISQGNSAYYLYNGHGDVVQLYNGSGTLTREYDYDAFGNEVSPNASDANPFRYAGQYYDTETGTYYLRARYYDPSVGRFTQQDEWAYADPSDPLSLNLYTYCINNPVRYIDPSGERWIDVWNGLGEWLYKSLMAFDEFASNNLGIDTAAFGAMFLAMWKDDNGVYHAAFDCWQAYCGYSDLYDIAFDFATDALKHRFEFSSKGEKYAIWCWKGDYMNMGAGAELGIYKQLTVHGNDLPHWVVDKSLAMHMSMSVIDKEGNTIIDYHPKDKQWWITGFNPSHKRVKASDLTVTYTIHFNSKDMYEDFYNSFGKGGNKILNWTFNPSSHSASYVF